MWQATSLFFKFIWILEVEQSIQCNLGVQQPKPKSLPHFNSHLSMLQSLMFVLVLTVLVIDNLGTIHILRKHILRFFGPPFGAPVAVLALRKHILCTKNRQKLPFSNPLPPVSAYVIYEWSFSIRVSQHSCSSRNTPPKDCLQYFTGSTGKDECKLF